MQKELSPVTECLSQAMSANPESPGSAGRDCSHRGHVARAGGRQPKPHSDSAATLLTPQSARVAHLSYKASLPAPRC